MISILHAWALQQVGASAVAAVVPQTVSPTLPRRSFSLRLKLKLISLPAFPARTGAVGFRFPLSVAVSVFSITHRDLRRFAFRVGALPVFSSASAHSRRPNSHRRTRGIADRNSQHLGLRPPQARLRHEAGEGANSQPFPSPFLRRRNVHFFAVRPPPAGATPP